MASRLSGFQDLVQMLSLRVSGLEQFLAIKKLVLPGGFTPMVAEYTFREKDEVKINDIVIPNLIYGDVIYANQVVEILAGAKYHDWIFVLEYNKMSKTMAIGGFFRGCHCTFQGFTNDTTVDDFYDGNYLLSFIGGRIVELIDPVIYEQALKSKEKQFTIDCCDVTKAIPIIVLTTPLVAPTKIWTPDELNYCVPKDIRDQICLQKDCNVLFEELDKKNQKKSDK